MQWKMIVSRALFTFTFKAKGRLSLESVRFLDDALLEQKNDVLLVKNSESIDFFLSGSVPLASLSPEQCTFIAAAARFFGHLPGRDNLPLWIWSGGLKMRENRVELFEEELVSC